MRPLKPLGRRDQLVAWKKTGVCPNRLTSADWVALPGEMTVRQLEVQVNIPGLRTRTIMLATTLLDPQACPAAAFAERDRRRRLAELFPRDIKISLGMDLFKCKTPAMLEKELLLYQPDYNLIRALICAAAKSPAVAPAQFSFKRTAEALRQWTPVLLASRNDPGKINTLTPLLVRYIGQLLNPQRPDCTEPRALKRRHKTINCSTNPDINFKYACIAIITQKA